MLARGKAVVETVRRDKIVRSWWSFIFWFVGRTTVVVGRWRRGSGREIGFVGGGGWVWVV